MTLMLASLTVGAFGADVDEPTEPIDDPTTTEPAESEMPVEPTEEPVEPTEEPVEPTEEPVEPTEEPVEPTEEPVEPTEEPVEPTEDPIEPTEEPVEPTEKPAEATEKPAEATEKPVEPTEEPELLEFTVTLHYGRDELTDQVLKYSTLSDQDPVKVSAPEKPVLEAFVFGGWFTDEACTAPYDFDLDLTEDLDLYAMWSRKLVKLTISEKASQKGDSAFAGLGSGQGFIYLVEGNVDGVSVSLTVAVPANGSTTIVNLPAGTYTITELSSWSWRFLGAAQQTMELTGDTGVSFSNDMNNYDWLSGCAFYK